jgi:hypothetical protein
MRPSRQRQSRALDKPANRANSAFYFYDFCQ